jgi:hypothetical protein
MRTTDPNLRTGTLWERNWHAESCRHDVSCCIGLIKLLFVVSNDNYGDLCAVTFGVIWSTYLSKFALKNLKKSRRVVESRPVCLDLERENKSREVKAERLF